MSKNLFIICFCFFPKLCFANIDSLLQILDQTIFNQNEYIQERVEKIDNFKVQLSSIPSDYFKNQYQICQLLFNEYKSFQYDSAFSLAFKQYELAILIKDEIKKTEAKLNLSFVLRSSGMYKEVFDSLNTIRSKVLADSLAVVYFEQMARAYYDLAAYNSDQYYAAINNNIANLYADSALNICVPKSLTYYRIAGLKSEANGDLTDAIFMFQSIIEKFPIDMHQYAMACYSLGKINELQKKEEESVLMIIQAAIADIKSSTKESVALIELAKYLQRKGDTERASNYINQASSDARFYGARHRIMQVSAILPSIESDRLAKAEYKSKQRLIFLIVLSIISFVIMVFTFVIIRQFRLLKSTKRHLNDAYDKLQNLNDKLLESNTIKEEYIGHSFNKDSEYLHKLEKFKNDIEKKLDERKFDDLRYVIRLFNMKREQEALYTKFDEIFLKLFPNFVTYFNSFFKPEDQFKIKDSQSLPVELRIFALIRIGITDHEQIASILGYSVRTVYNYKTKIKSKSILSNDDFEERLMEVKTF